MHEKLEKHEMHDNHKKLGKHEKMHEQHEKHVTLKKHEKEVHGRVVCRTKAFVSLHPDDDKEMASASAAESPPPYPLLSFPTNQ